MTRYFKFITDLRNLVSCLGNFIYFPYTRKTLFKVENNLRKAYDSWMLQGKSIRTLEKLFHLQQNLTYSFILFIFIENDKTLKISLTKYKYQ